MTGKTIKNQCMDIELRINNEVVFAQSIPLSLSTGEQKELEMLRSFRAGVCHSLGKTNVPAEDQRGLRRTPRPKNSRRIKEPAGTQLETQDTSAFAPLVEACKEHGISRTVAFELAASGKLETFAIGRRRYVKLESLRTLPDRISDQPGDGR